MAEALVVRTGGLAGEKPASSVLTEERAQRLAGDSPSSLRSRRLAAWRAVQELPMPSSHVDEDWRRTDISKLRIERFVPAAAATDADLEAARRLRDTAAPGAAVVVTGGGATLVGDAEPLLAQGIVISSLGEAARRHPELVERGLAQLDPTASRFTAITAAFWEGGAFVHVPAGVRAMAPVWLSHAVHGDLAFEIPLTVVVLGAGASLTLVEDETGDDCEQLLAGMTVADLGDGAALDQVSLQRLGDASWRIATHRARLGRDARLRFCGVSLGARLQKSWWDAVLDGQGSEAHLAGLALCDGERHLDHQSLQLHRAAETTSRLLLKAAARDASRSVYSGLIDVEPAAVHADGHVQNRNLLLSPAAKASGIPRLEIKANDVRCGHGTTVGHIDDDERFYLMARGVPAEDADRLIVRGFAADVIDQVSLEPLHDWLLSQVDEALGGPPAVIAGDPLAEASS